MHLDGVLVDDSRIDCDVGTKLMRRIYARNLSANAADWLK
jgi:hypothetical protein